jgi:hypothetical protein
MGVAAAWAGAPMDLDSPFEKVALIQEKNGDIAERSVRKGKVNGENIEMEKDDGALLVLPQRQVLAVLPRLPSSGLAYLQSDAQRALKVLQEAQPKFPLRSEVTPEAISEWEKLSAVKTEHDEVQSAALEKWIERCSRLSSEATPEEIARMREEGGDFLMKFPARSKDIEREIKGLREIGAIDLKKVDSVTLPLGPLGENFVPGAVLWALLLVPLLVAVKALPNAVQGFREGVPLAGLLQLLIGGLAVAFFVSLLLRGGSVPGLGQVEGKLVSSAARKAGWYALNFQEKWANQAPKKVSLPLAEWRDFLHEKVEEGPGADSFPFWYLAKPTLEQGTGTLVLTQPLQAKFIRLTLRFIFPMPKTGQSLTDLEVSGASMGKIPVGAALGQQVWQFLQPSYQPVAEKCGLNQGVRWLGGEGDTVVVEIPETRKPKPQAKESLSARELAEVFDQGFGEIYEGKVVRVEGALVEVSSLRETLGVGTQLEKQDPMDEFTLEGIPEGSGRKYALRVRCQFKSSESYFLDAKGDLFKSAPVSQNPGSDIPILRRRDGVTKVRVSAGRVESKPTETRLITLYDCRKVEGFDGKEWVGIWGN